MIILGIETSCDETAAAILKGNPLANHSGSMGVQILSNVVASSASLQEKFGGIIPEQAAREQIKSIIPVIEEALRLASLAQGGSVEPDAIAVTFGPGLIGSLLVGVETAKTLALIWNKPLIAVNHLLGHFYANWINQYQVSGIKYNGQAQNPSIHNTLYSIPMFPCLGLLVSGGHTDLVLFTDHGKYNYLGGTRDDAAGECFDKCARLLGLPYPGGPVIAAEAAKFKVKSSKLKVKLPRPLLYEKTFDFSFSGLKTALYREVERLKKAGQLNDLVVHQLSFEVQQAIVDVLIDKTIRAAKKYHIDQIMLAGGVASNQRLVNDLRLKIKELKQNIKVFVPPPKLCTDNGAMIASAAFFQKPMKDLLAVQADPNLALSY